MEDNPSCMFGIQSSQHRVCLLFSLSFFRLFAKERPFQDHLLRIVPAISQPIVNTSVWFFLCKPHHSRCTRAVSKKQSQPFISDSLKGIWYPLLQSTQKQPKLQCVIHRMVITVSIIVISYYYYLELGEWLKLCSKNIKISNGRKVQNKYFLFYMVLLAE